MLNAFRFIDVPLFDCGLSIAEAGLVGDCELVLVANAIAVRNHLRIASGWIYCVAVANSLQAETKLWPRRRTLILHSAIRNPRSGWSEVGVQVLRGVVRGKCRCRSFIGIDPIARSGDGGLSRVIPPLFFEA